MVPLPRVSPCRLLPQGTRSVAGTTPPSSPTGCRRRPGVPGERRSPAGPPLRPRGPLQVSTCKAPRPTLLHPCPARGCSGGARAQRSPRAGGTAGACPLLCGSGPSSRLDPVGIAARPGRWVWLPLLHRSGCGGAEPVAPALAAGPGGAEAGQCRHRSASPVQAEGQHGQGALGPETPPFLLGLFGGGDKCAVPGARLASLRLGPG